MNAIVFEPLLPLWALALVAVAAALIGLVLLWRGARGAVLRIIALAALVALIANPQRRVAETTPLDDIAVIVTDESASQTLDHRDKATIAAASDLETRLKALGHVEIARASATGEDETKLIEAIENALAGAPRARLAGVFVITDGQASDAARAAALALDAPVHILLTGRANETDRKITLVNAPRYGIVKESVKISFRVDDLGPDDKPLDESGDADVTLRIDGKEILNQPVPIGAEVSFNAPLDHPGKLIIELEAAPRAGELTTRNNTAVLPVTAIRDRLRVLLISGEPHPGERVWRNLLKSDPAVDLVHFTILRPIEKGSPNELTSELALIPFPQDELFIDKLAEFDLVIFDRYTYRGVLQSYHFDNIARYVENGGAVLIAAGPEYFGPLSLADRRNLAFILPALPSGEAKEGPFRPQVTKEGEKHPVTANLPEENFWGRWLRIMPVVKRAGETLMQGPGGAPLLILNRVGKGRVGLLLSDQVWLWARGFDGGGPHAELLRRVAHWLMKEPELEEEQLSLAGVGDTLVISRRSMQDAPGPVELTDPSGAVRKIALSADGPGRFSAKLEHAARGLYRARDGDLFAVGAVGLAAAPEFEDVVSTGLKLKPLADRTHGGVFEIRRGADVALPALRRVEAGARAFAGSGWAGIESRRAYRTDSVSDAPLAPAAAWLALIAAALAGAWWLEGRAGRPGSGSSVKDIKM
ncbi:MAG: hypothetical protein GC153_03445 [Alphaproteobacteria bacterium]|nr:hypothetical protein [Alphaproteobacteria bacterium]